MWLGTRLRVNHDKIVEVETLWTTTAYWLFNADAYLKYSSTEKWDPIPAEKRATRGALVAAANAYLDAFLEKKPDMVPWGFPCVRIEGGMYTGKDSPQDSCEVGVPAGVNIANRRFVVDEVIGTVQVLCTFGAGTPGGGSGAPDSHLFRVENGKLRYVAHADAPAAVGLPWRTRRRRCLLGSEPAGQGTTRALPRLTGERVGAGWLRSVRYRAPPACSKGLLPPGRSE